MADALQHDVVVVGGGGAGIRAAIAASENADVAMVSKVYPMRSHTVAAEGGAAAVIKEGDSREHHIYDTISGSDWLADQDAVELFVNEAPGELIQMERWGCPWSREPSGTVAVRPFGGMKKERTWFAADKTGFHMLHTLFQISMKYPITRYDEWFVTRLAVVDGRVQGVIAIHMQSGQPRLIRAKSVIVTTGGAGRCFPFTTNGAIKTGDGMAIAYQEGVPLKDMEFVQYHPTGLPGSGILITEACRGEGGIMLNNEGKRYLADHNLGTPVPVDDPRHPVKRTMELGPRDRLSQAFEMERRAGKTLQGRHGDYVELDLRHLGEKKIDKKLPFVRELAKNYAGVDPVHTPIPVRPVLHYMMGGIDTDNMGATSLPGLYAAGEVACVSINGANRLGSNSLTELLVFGKRAGDAAAAFAKENPKLNEAGTQQALEKEQARIREKFLLKTAPAGREGERVATIRREMNLTLEEGAGIFRSEVSLQATCNKIAELKERFEDVVIDDRSNCFNTDLTGALELEFMLVVAETLAHSALQRRESRGAHQREDFTERKDEQYLKHSMAIRDPGGGPPKIEYKDVVITKWPAGARTYGADSGAKDA